MNITAVIVTFNRIDMLKKSLDLYNTQSVKMNRIIIVNNNSSDGTKEYLNQWKEVQEDYSKIVINLEENIGGSGGFYIGFQEALKHKADWIWVSDDDAFVKKNTFENFQNFINSLNNDELGKIAVISGKVINYGEIDLNHRRRIKKKFISVVETCVSKDEYTNKYFQCDLISYVGIFINYYILSKAEMPEKEYFIFYDDSEHSLSLKKYGKIICVPDIEVEHNVKSEDTDTISWKTYYGIRNKLLTYKKHFGYLSFLRLIMVCIKNIVKEKSKEKNKLYKEAVKDAFKNKKGIHKIYKPGWKMH